MVSVNDGSIIRCVLGHSGQQVAVKCSEAVWINSPGGIEIPIGGIVTSIVIEINHPQFFKKGKNHRKRVYFSQIGMLCVYCL